MNIKTVLVNNYLSYAKGVIVGRAIPAIDGLKPSQRRILYTAYGAKLLNGDKMKCSNIVGRTMAIHPHGDTSIYDTLVNMTIAKEALNVPYIEGKGSFGKVYSSELAPAAPRYTEAKLAPICAEMFDGIDENAVDMVPNFDNTTVEPSLLPVKFPSVLVNSLKGVAVGIASNIPTFPLNNVCKATIGMIKNEITDSDTLMEVLGLPEFPTGGYIHYDKKQLKLLGETGRGRFIVSGAVSCYKDRIVVHEIPYNTTAEDIIESIKKAVESKQLKEVSDVKDEIDKKGFQITIKLKMGSNSKEVLRKLCRLTPLRNPISFCTSVIIGDNYEQSIGLYKLLEKWIEFRVNTISRIYKFRLDKLLKEEHLLKVWETIDSKETVQVMASHEEEEIVKYLKEKYSLDDEQCEYILDMRIRYITVDNRNKKLKELSVKREAISNAESILNSDNEKYKIIIDDLERIMKKYGKDRRTKEADVINEEEDKLEVKKVDDSEVTVILTKSGYLKRLTTLNECLNYRLPEGEEQFNRWNVRNNEYLLVFTYSGDVYKILVENIDSSVRKGLQDEVYKILNLNSKKDIMYIDSAGDYNKHFNLVYENGKGKRVCYSDVSGPRMKYKGVYPECQPGKVIATFADKFFLVTNRNKAAYCDLTFRGLSINNDSFKFKVATISSSEHISFIVPEEKVPDMSVIDTAKYTRGYTVSIKDDVLWEGGGETRE